VNEEHFQVTVRDGVPITAGRLSYAVARQVADNISAERKLVAEIKDEATGEVVYTIRPFADNVIPLRPGIRPQGEEHGPER